MKRLYVLPALLMCGAVLAQAPDAQPSAQQIIDALKTRSAQPAAAAAASASTGAASSAPKPRKTRNFSVEAATPVEPTAAPTATAAPAASATASASASQPNSISLAIQFERNSDKVQASSMQTLAALASAMKSPELSKLHFRLEGHTDGTGQAAYNRKLSAMRAEQVKRVLVINQVAPERLVTEGKGSSELANPADPSAPENRRVRIVSLE